MSLGSSTLSAWDSSCWASVILSALGVKSLVFNQPFNMIGMEKVVRNHLQSGAFCHIDSQLLPLFFPPAIPSHWPGHTALPASLLGLGELQNQLGKLYRKFLTVVPEAWIKHFHIVPCHDKPEARKGRYEPGGFPWVYGLSLDDPSCSENMNSDKGFSCSSFLYIGPM